MQNKFFKCYFFLSAIIDRNNLDPTPRAKNSFSTFKRRFLNSYDHPKTLYNCHNPKSIKFITRIRLALSYFHQPKFKNSFQDLINTLRKCGSVVESTVHFFFHCPFFIKERRTFLSIRTSIDTKL